MKKREKTGLKPFDFFTIGFGAIVGVGWAVSINNWMASAGGPLSAATGYILALVMMIPITLCYAELSPMLPVAGGDVAFAYKAFGQRVAFIAGWAALGAYVTIIPWEAIYTTEILRILVPVIGAGEPLYAINGTNVYLGNLLVGAVISLAIFYLNWRGAQNSAMLQKFLCVALLLAAAAAIVAVCLKADFNNLQPLYENVGKGSHDSFWGGAIAIFATAPFFLAGFETIPQGIEDSAEQGSKRIGKAIVLSVVIACLFYALLLFTFGLAMPWKEFLNVDAPAAANLFKIVYGGGMGNALWIFILVGAACGLLSTWNAFMLAGSRLMVGLARAHLIPAAFAKMHSKHGTPTVALTFCLILSIGGPLLGLGLIDMLTSFSAAGFVLCWTISTYSLIRMRKTMPDAPRPYRIFGGLPMAVFGAICTTLIFIMFLIPGSLCYIGTRAVILFAVWMLLGLVMYVSSMKSRNAISPEERAKTLFAKMHRDEDRTQQETVI